MLNELRKYQFHSGSTVFQSLDRLYKEVQEYELALSDLGDTSGVSAPKALLRNTITELRGNIDKMNNVQYVRVSDVQQLLKTLQMEKDGIICKEAEDGL